MHQPNDPYRPPAQSTTTPSAPTGPLPTWSIVSAVGASLAVAVGMMQVVPQFNMVFVNFGAELPWLTRMLVGHPVVLLAWPALVVGLVLRWYANGTRVVPLVLVSGGGSCLVVLVTMLLMYLPIFRMAATT